VSSSLLDRLLDLAVRVAARSALLRRLVTGLPGVLTIQRRLFAAVTRLMYAQFNSSGEFPLWLAAPEIEFVQTPMFLDTKGIFHGHTGVVEAMKELYEGFGEMRFEPLALVMPRRDRAVVVVHARTLSSGVPLERDVGHRYDLEDGYISRMETYWEVSDAYEALGLTEQEADAIAIAV
jgi:ketosteroid isomerase-like protein